MSSKELLSGSLFLIPVLVFKLLVSLYPKDNMAPSRSCDDLTYLELIGHTPLILLKKLSDITQCKIFVKMESMNPGGTGKDRAVKAMLVDVLSLSSVINLQSKQSSPLHIYEGSSGSTGISLAAMGKALGLKVHIVVPDDQSQEKIRILEILGAQVTVVPTCSISNPQHYVNTARRLAKENHGIFLNQFENEANWKAHYETTGPEIVQQLHTRNQEIDAFVMVDQFSVSLLRCKCTAV